MLVFKYHYYKFFIFKGYYNKLFFFEDLKFWKWFSKILKKKEVNKNWNNHKTTPLKAANCINKVIRVWENSKIIYKKNII